MAIIKNSSKFEDNKFVVKSINNNYADSNGNITLQLDGQHIPTAIINISVDNKTGIITCTKGDGSSFQVDTLLEKVVTNFTYDNATKSLNLILEDGTVQKVSLSALIKEYSGKNGTTIDVTVEQASGKIGAEVKNTSISKTHLTTELASEIDSKETIANVDKKLQSKANSTHKHNATDITQDVTHRFVSDTEKTNWNSKIGKSTKHQIVLSSANWVGESAPYTYPIAIEGMDSEKNWEVTNSVEPLMTEAELTAFGEAKIIAGSQTTNTINLVAYGKKPTMDINILVIVRGD